MGEKFKLSPKRKRFCEEYVIDHNGTQAYIRAGYSKNGAGQSAKTLLKNTEVQRYVAHLEGEITAKLAEKYLVTRERILKERARIAFFQADQMYDADGALKPPKKWGEDLAACISSVKTREIYAGGEGEKKKIGEISEIKLHTKEGSLTALEKIMGMYEEHNKQKVRSPEEAKERLKKLASLNKIPLKKVK